MATITHVRDLRSVAIDTQQVKLPNASHLGYDKRKAQFGDMVLYAHPDTPDRYHTARVLGRIEYAPAAGEIETVKDWLCVAQIGEFGQSAYERWIDPSWVIRCESFEDWRRSVSDWIMLPTAEWCARTENDIHLTRLALHDGHKDVPARVREIKDRLAAAKVAKVATGIMYTDR